MNVFETRYSANIDDKVNSNRSESSRLQSQAVANNLQPFADSLAKLHKAATEGQNVNGELVAVLKDATEQFPHQAVALEGLMQVCGRADEFIRKLDDDNENGISVTELSVECQQITSSLYSVANMSSESATAPTLYESENPTLGESASTSTTANASALAWESRYAAMGSSSVLLVSASAAISAINVSYASVAAFQARTDLYNKVLDDLNGFMSFLSLLNSFYAEVLQQIQTDSDKSSYSQVTWGNSDFTSAVSTLVKNGTYSDEWTQGTDPTTGLYTIYFTADSMPAFMQPYCTTTKSGYYGINTDVMDTVALQISSEVSLVDDTTMSDSWTGTSMQTNTQTSAYSSACSDDVTAINSNLSSLVSEIQLLQQGVTNMQSLWSNILSLYQNIVSSLTK